MTQVDLGLTNVSRFDSTESIISVNDANKKRGASQPGSGKQSRLQQTREPVAAEDRKLMIGPGSWIVGILLLFLGLLASVGMVTASTHGGGVVAGVVVLNSLRRVRSRRLRDVAPWMQLSTTTLRNHAQNAAHRRFDLLGAGGDLRRAGQNGGVGWRS
jgi:hypothetical protein